MTLPADASFVIEKIQKALALGDQCYGMAMGKSVPEWKDIFNEASRSLEMPVVSIAPLKGASPEDVSALVTDIARAFQQTAGKSALILADATGNRFLTGPDASWRISNGVEWLTKKFPKAVYVQIVPELSSDQPLNMYCMNPKKPRDPSQPIHPV